MLGNERKNKKQKSINHRLFCKEHIKHYFRIIEGEQPLKPNGMMIPGSGDVSSFPAASTAKSSKSMGGGEGERERDDCRKGRRMELNRRTCG